MSVAKTHSFCSQMVEIRCSNFRGWILAAQVAVTHVVGKDKYDIGFKVSCWVCIGQSGSGPNEHNETGKSAQPDCRRSENGKSVTAVPCHREITGPETKSRRAAKP